jgi:hypothetical protein
MTITHPTTIVSSETTGVEPGSEANHLRFLIVALLVTTVVWVPLFVARVQSHQANVDDYFYASVARGLIWHGNFVHSFLHTGTTSPLVPTLAAPGADIYGVYGAMTVELPFLLLLVAGSYLLARRWVSPAAAMVTALAVGLNENVSGYAVMLHFAVPEAAALVWSFLSYTRSRRLRDWKWSAVFGVAIAAMLLSRSMAIVYVIPLVAIVGIDLLVDVWKNGTALRLPVLLALGTTLVLAGPWWLESGHAAIRYLKTAGYQPSSGFTSRGATLDVSAIVQRVNWSLTELGWGESWALAIALLAALWLVARHRRNLTLSSLWVPVAWVVLTIILLSTSSNHGTAYGLPVIVVLVIVTGAVIGQRSGRIGPLLSVIVAGILVVGLVAEVRNGTASWWPGAPYRIEVVAAGGNARTDVDLRTAQVVRLIGSAPTLEAQDSDILNINGIRWNAGHRRLSLLVPPSTPDGTQVAIGDLARVNTVITGLSTGSYHPLVNQAAVESAARRQGFHAIRAWVLTQNQSFLVWRRGTKARAISAPPPVTGVLLPSDGAQLKGSVFLVARASDPVYATTQVEFTVRGTAQETNVPAHVFNYGWIARLQTTALPNGTYTVQSTAMDAGGDVGRSKPIVVHIDN